MTFEVLGFDILLDKNCKPYLLEVNHAPSFKTDSELDYKIKYALIEDTLRLLNLTPLRKFNYKKEAEEKLQLRIKTGKRDKLTPEERDALRAEIDEKRQKYEAENCGRYFLIYPHPKTESYYE